MIRITQELSTSVTGNTVFRQKATSGPYATRFDCRYGYLSNRFNCKLAGTVKNNFGVITNRVKENVFFFCQMARGLCKYDDDHYYYYYY